MAGVPRLSRRARWAVPAGGLVIIGAVAAGSLISVAQASPGLPPRTAAQLLVQVRDSATPPLTGTVVETTSLGLPALPGTSDPTSIAALLTGSHTVNVWYAGPRHFRLAVPGQLSETDLITDGGTAWLWDSTANSVTEYSLPAGSKAAATPPTTAPLTPQQAAQQVLAAVGETTTVRVDSNVTVAGQPAYELVLAPKDSRSLIGQVQIAVDGRNGVPLRLQVYARNASSPAFQVGYTAIQFVTPAPADLTFTPPPGASVDKVNLGDQPAPGAATQKQKQDMAGFGTYGTGWLTVVSLPQQDLLSSLGTGAAGSNAPAAPSAGPGGLGGDSQKVIGALLGAAKPVSGSWGHGTLLQTSLVSMLMTGGEVYIGAVEPSVLYAAVGHTS